ncbi:DUF3347 domain-containing protein [Roseivirga echinicomitans]|nr:DUF3347 domain-containing protein [Roseivirga echinicomitans]
MVKTQRPSILIALAFLFLACQPEKGEQTQDSMPSAVYPYFKEPKISFIYERYLDIKGALVAGDAKMAQKSADVFQLSIGSSSNLSDLAKSIKKESEIDKQRKLFTTLSIEILKLLEKHPPVNGKVFAFRSMSDSSEVWLANEARVNSPYDGSISNGKLFKVMGKEEPASIVKNQSKRPNSERL